MRWPYIWMLAGGRCYVNPTGFKNDLAMTNSRDDVLTVLIHLDYLAYDRREDECYVPNREVAIELVNAVRYNNWTVVANAIEKSRQLMQATLADDADTVAIAQIKERRYWEKVAECLPVPGHTQPSADSILLVGISYDKDTKTHECRVEKLHQD